MARLSWAALLLALALYFAAAPLIAADEEVDESDVLVVTSKNFDEKVKASKYALVEFYAPWCGHCKKLTPEWAKAATALKAHDATLIIGKVDATVENALGEKYGVKGYPTIKWFVDGEVALDYNGPRDADGIVRWVKKKSGPVATPVADTKALAAAEAANTVVLLAYFKELKGAAYDAFVAAASKTEDAAAYETTDAATAKAGGLTAPGVAVITNHPSETRAATPLKGEVTTEAISALLASEKLPPTIEFNDQNSQTIFGSGINHQLLLLASAADLKPASKVFKAYRAAALALKGKLVFVTVDLDGSSKDPVVNFFGADVAAAPLVLGFDSASSKKYRVPGKDLSEKVLTAFGKDLVAGKLTPEFKSAPIPDEPTEGGVTVVVGKNFDAVVRDASKDVLLEVYAPWCGHCKSLEPIYKKLAKKFEKIDTVVIAKMDGTANEAPDVDVKGFPTIMFFPAEKGGSPIQFEGDRSLAGMTKFIQRNAKIAFDLPADADGDEDDGHGHDGHDHGHDHAGHDHDHDHEEEDDEDDADDEDEGEGEEEAEADKDEL